MKSPEQKTNTPAVSEHRRDVILEKIKISKQDQLVQDITVAQKLEQEQGPFSSEVIEKKKEIRREIQEVAGDLEHTVDETVEKVASVSEQEKDSITKRGGNIEIVEQRLQPELGVLKTIRENISGKFAKVAAVLGLMSLSENVMSGENGKKVIEQEKVQETSQDVLRPVGVTDPEEKELKVRKPIMLQKEYKREFNWMKDLMKSPEYLKRVTENEGLSMSDVKDRIRNINNGGYHIVDQKTIDAANAQESLPGEVKGYYDGETTYLSNNKKMKKEAIAVHEFDHQSTDANENLSDTAIAFYKKAFQDPNNLTKQNVDYYEMAVKSAARDKDRIKKMSQSHLSNKDIKKKIQSVISDFDNLPDSAELFADYEIKYLSEPTELSARKRQLDYFLEKSSIKKYGEVFTKKHYDLLIKLGKEGKLPFGVVQLLISIKPECFEEMMNTLADVTQEKTELINSLEIT